MRTAAMGVVRRDDIGDFDAYVEERAIGDQFATFSIRFHDRCQDTLKRKTVTRIGEHDQAFRKALRRRVFGKTIIKISTDDDIGMRVARPCMEREHITQLHRQPPLHFREVQFAVLAQMMQSNEAGDLRQTAPTTMCCELLKMGYYYVI